MNIEILLNRLYYWRGMTLNHFDGISWMDTFKEKAWIYKEDGRFNIKPFKKEGAIIQRIFLEPMDTNVVFGLSEIAAVEARGTILKIAEFINLYEKVQVRRERDERRG
jgi:hypothetical protein